MDKRKISFWQLSVEITRRCNLKCKHCFRGDEQDITLSCEAIDALLDQTEMIHDLFFTGGEPFLALDQIAYFFDGIRRRNIKLLRVSLVTNGTIINRKVLDTFIPMTDYIIACRAETEKNETPIFINVSIDKFHEQNGNNPNNNFIRLKMLLYPKIAVGRITSGNVPNKMGRAENLDNDATYHFPKIPYHLRGIQVKSANTTAKCPNDKGLQIKHPSQYYIMCNMYLNALGFMRNAPAVANNDYVDADKVPYVCSVFDNIIDSISAYNTGKLPCDEFMRLYCQGDYCHPSKLNKYYQALEQDNEIQRTAILSMANNNTGMGLYDSIKMHWGKKNES